MAHEILVSSAFGDSPVKDLARHSHFHRSMGIAPSGDARRHGFHRLAANHLLGPRCVVAAAQHRVSICVAMLSDVAIAEVRNLGNRSFVKENGKFYFIPYLRLVVPISKFSGMSSIGGDDASHQNQRNNSSSLGTASDRKSIHPVAT